MKLSISLNREALEDYLFLYDRVTKEEDPDIRAVRSMAFQRMIGDALMKSALKGEN